LILSDRLAGEGRFQGERRARLEGRMPPPAKQAGGLDAVVLHDVLFDDSHEGSPLRHVAPWIAREANVEIEVNWRALELVKVMEDSRVRVDAKEITLAALMDAIAGGLQNAANQRPGLAWAFDDGWIVYLTSVDDLAAEKRWREQRAKEASAGLRRELDRKLPYVKLRELPVEEALRHCARVSGVKIDLEFSPDEKARVIDVVVNDVSFEKMLELVLRRVRGEKGALRMRADGDRLVVFREEAR
jgi:hypothetical protein